MLEKLMGSLDPKAHFKKMFFDRLPAIKEDLNVLLDDLFSQAAEYSKVSPFSLSLVLVKNGDKADGIFFNEDKQMLSTIDAGQLIQDNFLKQLSVFPEEAVQFAMGELGGDDAKSIVANALKKRKLLIQYGENDDYVYTEITREGTQVIDLDEFFNDFEF